jgi:hypothetical protein
VAPGKRTRTEAHAIPHRATMEAAFGADFGGVRAHLGAADAMHALGAEAAASGETVAFASPSPSPWLVAHELAHVVQERRRGSGSGAASDQSSAAEREADAVADRVAAGEPAGPIVEAPAAAVQRFAPENHEEVTARGLSPTFSREEIGAIYQANWERDFSQGHRAIANAAIAWSHVKRVAVEAPAEFDAAADEFLAAVEVVIEINFTDSTEQSLGGYRYWEHMDQPSIMDNIDPLRIEVSTEAVWDNPDPHGNAEDRWEGASNRLAGYLCDSKAYIKDQMVAAIDAYRLATQRDLVGGEIDNWSDVEKPPGYTSPGARPKWSDPETVTTRLPADHDDDRVEARAPIRADAAERAAGHGARTDAQHDEALWSVVGQHLGRAMHAFEDFWAHSNWLELAQDLKSGAEERVDNTDLFTGEFGTGSKAHALGHKLLALASAFRRDTEAMRRICAGVVREDDEQIIDATENLHDDAGGAKREMLDVSIAADDVEELIQDEGYRVEQFLCNDDWLAAVEAKGEALIEEGDRASGREDHGSVAKDQHEHGNDFEAASRLAAAANLIVFAPLRPIMDERDVDRALALTEGQLTLVDRMLQAPSPDHPLWELVETPTCRRLKPTGICLPTPALDPRW